MLALFVELELLIFFNCLKMIFGALGISPLFIHSFELESACIEELNRDPLKV